MHEDHQNYFRFTTKSRLDKAVNSLLGIVEGISLDSEINDSEIRYLNEWVIENEPHKMHHPLNELVPVVNCALEDGVLDEEERQDILWLCEKLRSTDYHDAVTADMQRLHAIMGAILADGIITENELMGLSEWLDNHDHLRSCWPYDELDSAITAVMADHKIDPKEHEFLLSFFQEFATSNQARIVPAPSSDAVVGIQGICAVCPEITFPGSLFCFTGTSQDYTRKQFSDLVISLGGQVSRSVTQKVNYLIIGAGGNPCWTYACYGRKVEAAVNLRKQGNHLFIVHENDFKDTAEDAAL